MQSFLRKSIRLPDLLAVLILIGTALIVFWRPIVHGEVFLPLDLLAHMPPWRYSYERTPIINPIPSDLLLEYYPRRLIAREMLEAGQLPLWNPYILGGTPLLADGNSGLLYPLGVLFWILPLSAAFGWYAFLHLTLAGIGAYLLARILGLHTLPALFAAIVYQWCGFSMTWIVFPDFSPILAWLPWILACVERYEQVAIRRFHNIPERMPAALPSPPAGAPGLKPRAMQSALDRLFMVHSGALVIAVGILLAFCILCQLQLAFYAGVATGFYWLLRRLLAHPRDILGALAALAAAGTLALLLSAAQWLPTMELILDSQRSGVTTSIGGNLNASALLRFLSPTVFGVPVTRPGWGPPTMDVLYPYVGWLPLLLALYGAWQARTIPAASILSSALLALVMAALPPEALRAIPLLNQLPGVDRWTLVLSLTLAILAGFGLQAVGEPRIENREPRNPNQAARHPETRWPHTFRMPIIRFFMRFLCCVAVIIVAGVLLSDWQLFTPNSRYGEYMTRLAPQFAGLPGITAIVSLCLFVIAIVSRVTPFTSLFTGAKAAGLRLMCLLIVFLDLGWYGLPSLNSADPRQLFRPTGDLTAALGEARIDAAYTPDRVFPETRLSAALTDESGIFRVFAGDYPSFQPNMLEIWGLYDVRGYSSLFSHRYLQFARRWEGKSAEGAGYTQIYLTQAYETRHLLDLMGVRYLFFNPGSSNLARYAGLELLERNDEGTLYRNPTALPRAFLVHTAEQLPNSAAVLDRLTAPGFPVGQRALLTVAPPPLSQPDTAEPVPQITHYTPLEVRITAEPTAPALLVLSDSFFPGWQTTVNGQPAPIYEVNAMLRGVALQPGKNEIIFSYLPITFIIGTIISILSLCTLIIMITLTLRRTTSHI